MTNDGTQSNMTLSNEYVQQTIPLCLDLDHHLSEMAATLQEFECFFGLDEGEDTVDHRVNLVFLVETDHLFKPVLRTIDNSFEGNCSPESQKIDIQTVVTRVHLARDVANAVDETSECDAVKALSQRLCTSGLQNNIGAVLVGILHDFCIPVGIGAVVDSMVSTKLFRLIQLCIRRGRDNHCKVRPSATFDSQHNS